jgi:hypothetical protein
LLLFVSQESQKFSTLVIGQDFFVYYYSKSRSLLGNIHTSLFILFSFLSIHYRFIMSDAALAKLMAIQASGRKVQASKAGSVARPGMVGVPAQVRLLGDPGGFSTPVGGRGGVSMMDDGEDEDDGVEDMFGGDEDDKKVDPTIDTRSLPLAYLESLQQTLPTPSQWVSFFAVLFLPSRRWRT